MKEFSYLEHKADLYIEGRGKDFKEALEAVAEGMLQSISHVEKLGKKEKITIEEKAKNLQELIVFSLSDLLSESEERLILIKEFKIIEFGKNESEGYYLKAEAWGEKAQRSKAKGEIKAVTFHDLQIKEGEDNYIIRVLFDV